MKLKLLLLLAGFAGILVSCKKDHVIGGGTVKTEKRELTGFTKVIVEGSTDVHITSGTNFDVQVKAYANLLPHLKTRLENGALFIKYDNSANPVNDNSEIYITMPALNGLHASGSGDIDVKGSFDNIQSFDAEINGSSDISVEHATAEKLKVSISGSGDFKSFGVYSDEAEISITGSGDVEITVDTKLKAKICGSGNIYYKGNPSAIDDDITGSGDLIKK